LIDRFPSSDTESRQDSATSVTIIKKFPLDLVSRIRRRRTQDDKKIRNGNKKKKKKKKKKMKRGRRRRRRKQKETNATHTLSRIKHFRRHRRATANKSVRAYSRILRG